MISTENRAAQSKLRFFDPFYVKTCEFISIIFDIRLKIFVAISTVKDAMFEVCKYT